MVDERLIPNGQYIDALNIRMGSTENSEVGVIENSKGNSVLTDISVEGNSLSSSARCIGAFQDGSDETIYWFVHDSNFTSSATGKADLILSFDTKTNSTVYHIISIDDGGGINTTLNFDSAYLVTGINKIENLLYFTDNYTAPKQINVKKNYANPIAGIDGFSLESLLVIKKPPTYSPTINPIATSSQDNFLEDRFISFAYRYRYEDGEYSATSQFSAPSFVPKTFDYNFATALNDGMLNSTNACTITYNSGGPLVKSVDLLFKDMNSSVIKIIEKINKEERGIADDQDYTFDFNNSKIFTILPSSEILRLYDNVPRLAKSQTLMGNRLIYGNYLEGYDLEDKDQNPTKLEYIVNYDSEEIGLSPLTYTLTDGLYTWDTPIQTRSVVNIDLGGVELVQGAVINLLLRFTHRKWSGGSPEPIEETAETTIEFSYRLPVTFATVNGLANSPDFIEKIGFGGITGNIESDFADSCDGITFTDAFNCSIPNELSNLFKITSGITGPNQEINILSSYGSDLLRLQLPAVQFVDDLLNPTVSFYEYYDISIATVSFQELGDPKSLHSNRGYELGMVYMDEYNRMSTALVSPDNNLHIPCSASDTANSLSVIIPTTQVAPYWAKNYKFVIKPDKKGYDVIYSNFFFRDPTSGSDFFLLEGQNSTKVEVGDELIVKTDTTGPRGNCVWTTVLDKTAQLKDFLDPAPVDVRGDDMPIPAGTYMQIKANNFSTEVGDLPVVAYGEKQSFGSGCRVVSYPVDRRNPNWGDPGESEYIDYDIPAGSRINISILSNRSGSGNVDPKTWKVDAIFTASNDYANFKQWFDGDNIASALESQATDIRGGVEGPNYSVVDISPYSRPCSWSDIYTSFYRPPAIPFQERSYFTVKSTKGYSSGRKRSLMRVNISVIRATNTIIFESDPQDAEPDLWYESSVAYPIGPNGEHIGSIQDQNFTTGAPSITKTDFFNCFAFGNGAESYKIKDSIIGKELVLGNRATTTDSKLYGEENRFSDLTYSGVYNAESNINKLNEFNGGLLNYKNLEQSFGPVIKLFGRETDILTLQEDKISYVLAGKNLLSDASGGNALTSVPEVLGTQIARVEDFGISHNPESFVEWGADKYFTDAKRGAVIQLKGAGGQSEQLNVISKAGMRPWFRDLFNDSFTTQKLGGFDPYMNEFVLASNTIETPTVVECKDCGITETIIIDSSKNGGTYTYCYDLGALVGDVDIDYTVSSPISGTFKVYADYNGNIISTGDETSSGTLTLNKDEVLINEAIITVIATEQINLTLTIKCPLGDTITIVLVQVSSPNDSGEQIHNQYRWTDGAFQSPLHSEQVTFAGSYSTPIVSLYQTITGPQGGGVIPSNSAVVKIMSNKSGSDTFNFDVNSDNFRYLRSNTLYSNTSTDIRALILASTIPTPIYPPLLGNTEFYSTFPMPLTGDYLYMVWDYRDSTPIDLCLKPTAAEACCDCDQATEIYEVRDCETAAIFTIEDTFLTGIGINSTVQYVQGIGTGAGTFVYCGEIIGFGTTPDATLFSDEMQVCGDMVNCNYESDSVCTEYTLTYTGMQLKSYTYTDCNGDFNLKFIGGVYGFTATFCARTGTVVATGMDSQTNNGSCNY